MAQKTIQTDICIIGAGSGGLTLAAGAVQMGASVVLIEKNKMGGDCLNYGCVPSKSLLSVAKHAAIMKNAWHFGIENMDPKVNFSKVHDYVHNVIETIEPHDSVERFEKLGVVVLKAQARFMNTRIIQADNTHIKAKKIVIATGSSPFIPPIEGIATVPYLTNETIFDLKKLPSHMVIIGGGPIGIEMAQAFQRLGSQVTVLEGMKILPKDDPQMAEVVYQRLLTDGVKIIEGAKVLKVSNQSKTIKVMYEKDGETQEISATHLLLAVGRRPTLDKLNLDAAQIKFTPKGIVVDDRLRTSNKHVYAMGDAVGGYQFTHIATHHAEVILRNILFKLPTKVRKNTIPWVTYTDPEIAHVGLTEDTVKSMRLKYKVLRWGFKDIDRAQAEHSAEGGIKVIVSPQGRILGVTVVGVHAGELIQPWILAIEQNLKIGAIAKMMIPYPTLGEINKRGAGSFFTPLLFNERVKKIVRFLLRWC